MSPTKSIGTAVEHDLALPIRAVKSATLGTAVEYDIALPITVVGGSAAGAYLAIQSTVVHVSAPEQALHPQHAHDDLVLSGTETILVLVTIVVGARMFAQGLFRVQGRGMRATSG